MTDLGRVLRRVFTDADAVVVALGVGLYLGLEPLRAALDRALDLLLGAMGL